MIRAQDRGLTLDALKSRLDYDPQTGHFAFRARAGDTRFIKTFNTRFAGKLAGSKDRYGYLQIRINGVQYLAHLLAWFYQTGEWPPSELDHRNTIRHDNAWSNLRLATRSKNLGNARRPKTNTSGVKGVTWLKRHQRWLAQLHINGRSVGSRAFCNIDDAAAHYAALAKQHFGEFARYD